MKDKIRVKGTALIMGLWCDGCRQMPTMSIDRANEEKNKPHEMCPDGDGDPKKWGTWRLVVALPIPKRRRKPAPVETP